MLTCLWFCKLYILVITYTNFYEDLLVQHEQTTTESVNKKFCKCHYFLRFKILQILTPNVTNLFLSLHSRMES